MNGQMIRLFYVVFFPIFAVLVGRWTWRLWSSWGRRSRG